MRTNSSKLPPEVMDVMLESWIGEYSQRKSSLCVNEQDSLSKLSVLHWTSIIPFVYLPGPLLHSIIQI